MFYVFYALVAFHNQSIKLINLRIGRQKGSTYLYVLN